MRNRNRIKEIDPFVIKESANRDRSVKDYFKTRWVEDSFICPPDKALDPEGERLIRGPREFLGLSVSDKRLNYFLAFLLLGIFLLFCRSAYLQISKGEYYRDLAEGNRIRIQAIPAERGLIYDRNKTVLARNVPNFSLFIIPADLPAEGKARAGILDRLSSIIKIDKTEIEKAIEEEHGSYEKVLIKDNLSHPETVLLDVESKDLPGVIMEATSRRDYLIDASGELMLSLSHVLGYEGKITKNELAQKKNYSISDSIGRSGLEAYYEDLLRGVFGKQQIEVNALGKEKSVIAEAKPMTGESLVLTIDQKLQQQAEQILRQYLKDYKKTKGVVIVLNPNSGEILSLVSLPTFDSNMFSQGISAKDYQNLINNPNQPMFDRAISGEYPSGSTFKPIVAAGALEEGLITKNTTVNSTGGIQVDKWFFPDWKAGGHGITNVTYALAESINTFFYIIGGGYQDMPGLGVQKIVDYGKLFGLDAKTGVDLPNEASGFLPTKEWKKATKGEDWYIGDTYHLAIGQGDLLVTPLQVAAYTVFFANGGTLYKPYLVKSLLGVDGSEQIVPPTVVRKDFISPNNIDIVRQGLRAAVTIGSASRMQELPVASAGKTGTAQWGAGKVSHAWFTAFAPYNHPQIVVTALVEEGDVGEGITISIVKEVMADYFQNQTKLNQTQ